MVKRAILINFKLFTKQRLTSFFLKLCPKQAKTTHYTEKCTYMFFYLKNCIHRKYLLVVYNLLPIF